MLSVYEKAPLLALLLLRQREASVVTGESDTFAISIGFERKGGRGGVQRTWPAEIRQL